MWSDFSLNNNTGSKVMKGRRYKQGYSHAIDLTIDTTLVGYLKCGQSNLPSMAS